MKKIARKVTGQVLSAEVAVTALLMVIFLCMSTDTFICVYGFSALDEAARDAARAAAATNDPLNAYTAAQQAALSHKTDGILVTQPTVSGPSPAAAKRYAADPHYYPGIPGLPVYPLAEPTVNGHAEAPAPQVREIAEPSIVETFVEPVEQHRYFAY